MDVTREQQFLLDMRLPDGKTCNDCRHTAYCNLLYGGNSENTSCQFHPNRFWHKEVIPLPKEKGIASNDTIP